MVEIGINVAGRAEQSPSDIAALGATWARCVALPGVDLRDWIRGCHDRGVNVLLVLASESIGQAPGGWVGAIDHYAERYLGLVDAWQVGNEPDHESPSSWTMTSADLNRLLGVARQLLGTSSLLVGPGLVSGQPSWVQHIDLDRIDALAFHPYAKFPGTVELDNLIAGYARFGLSLWVTEYHARTIGMAAALRNDPRLSNVMAFCYSDRMVDGFGLVENTAALADYLLASGGPIVKPVVPPAHYQMGFADWADADRALLGDPLEDERGGLPGFSQQQTSNGILTAADIDKRGWTLLFWEERTGTRYLFEDGHSRRIA